MKTNRIKDFFALHFLLLLYSLGGICSKLAAGQPFLSFKFCLCYAGVICVLFIYAIGWQQIIGRMQLTTAFANKSITVIWGLVWGLVLFGERLTAGKLIGSILVICGVILCAISDRTESDA